MKTMHKASLCMGACILTMTALAGCANHAAKNREFAGSPAATSAHMVEPMLVSEGYHFEAYLLFRSWSERTAPDHTDFAGGVPGAEPSGAPAGSSAAAGFEVRPPREHQCTLRSLFGP